MNLDDIADITQVNEGFNKIDELLTEHEEKKVSSEGGVHGLRFNEETEELEVEKQDGEWTGVGGGGASAVFDPVTDIKIKAGNGKLTVSWSDPESSIFNTWAGTKVVYKTGSYPENPKDGTLAVDNKVKDQYKTNGFEINALNNETEYYFVFFPYDIKNKYNLNEENKAVGMPRSYKIMTVKINKDDENPETRCTYADDAVGMTPGSEEWDEFFGHYPCLFKNGQVVDKLKKDNRTKKEDGSLADITSGDTGDVGTIFPLRWWKMETSGRIVTVSVTDNPDAEGFEALAHTRGREVKDFFFVGAYAGSVVSGKLSSLAKKTPVNTQLSQSRLWAQANGEGYDQLMFYPLTYLQIMYTLKYKNTDSQTTIGKGYVTGNISALITGGTEEKPMDWGEQTGKQHMVLFGIEDLWGNVYQWVDGLVTDSQHNILTATQNFNNTGSGYENQGVGASSNIYGFVSDIQGTTKTGFIPKAFDGSETTHYSDYSYLLSSRTTYFGGAYSNDSKAGIFSFDISFTSGITGTAFGARLMYL